MEKISAVMRNVYFRLVLPAVIAILLFVLTIFLVIIPRYKQNIMNGKREMIKELTNSALSILARYEGEEREGRMSGIEARKMAASEVEYLRYGEENNDYFWITDMTPVMIMHPFRNDLNGKDLSDFTDPHGKRMFVEFVETVKASANGYVSYMWQSKNDSLQIVPKLSYVSLFEPWDWIVGTGVYIDDIRQEITSLTRRLILISTAILLLIVALLFYIARQSIGLERKREEAENELHRSQEKFRLLVEAATEGLIMITDGKINYSNQVISRLTGFENQELVNLPLTGIISRNNSSELINIFSQKSIREGKYELNLNRKNGGFVETLVTSSNMFFYDKAVNIIIVKDISVDNSINDLTIDHQRLLASLDKGLFKVLIGTKGKFLFANENALRIFDFKDHDEMAKVNFFSIISDAGERKALRKDLQENGYLRNRVISIFNRSCSSSVVRLTMVALNNENSAGMICDGIIEDISLQENEKKKTSELIAELKASSFLPEQPVKDFVAPVKIIGSRATISEAVHLLELHATDAVLVSKDDHDIIGIITSTDIQKRIIALDLKLDNPAYLIMSSPVKYINESQPVSEALRICDVNRISHLVVKNEPGQIMGMIRVNDIRKMAFNSLSFYIGKIRLSQTDQELKKHYNDLKTLIIPLIEGEVAVKYLTNLTASFSDALTRRIIELKTGELGEPPAGFSFICTGSEGRREESLYTDQDNAIIYEDLPGDGGSAAAEYFLKLGRMVCDSLDYAGYSFCKGNKMAKNPQWCQPMSTWIKYFTGWINTPEPGNLLEASAFFDLRTIYGDETYAEKLREIIFESIRNKPLFGYHMAYNTFITKAPHISTGILPEKIIDLKSAIAPFIMFGRTYSLTNGIEASNTIERFEALKEKNIINDRSADEMLYAYNYLMKLRLRIQADQLKNGLPLSNLLDPGKLTDIEITLLKKVLAFIPDIQNRIKMDFRIS